MRQLLPATQSTTLTVPACAITDKPRFSYRGLHLDVIAPLYPRGVCQKISSTDGPAQVNTFHWHLTDDQGWRIEIKKYPKLTKLAANARNDRRPLRTKLPQQFDGKPYGGFYTQEEIKEVVRYAQSRYITIVPEIEMPGHALAALAAYPELAATRPKPIKSARMGRYHDVFCPTEKTFSFSGCIDGSDGPFPEQIHSHRGRRMPQKEPGKKCFCRS